MKPIDTIYTKTSKTLKYVSANSYATTMTPDKTYKSQLYISTTKKTTLYEKQVSKNVKKTFLSVMI